MDLEIVWWLFSDQVPMPSQIVAGLLAFELASRTLQYGLHGMNGICTTLIISPHALLFIVIA